MSSHISNAVRAQLPKLNGDKAQRVLDVADDRDDKIKNEPEENRTAPKAPYK